MEKETLVTLFIAGGVALVGLIIFAVIRFSAKARERRRSVQGGNGGLVYAARHRSAGTGAPRRLEGLSGQDEGQGCVLGRL